MFCFKYPVYTNTFQILVQGLVPLALIHIYPRCERSWSLIALRSPRNTRFEDVVSILNATLKLVVSSTLSSKVVRLALSKALSLYLVKPSNKYWLRVWGWHLVCSPHPQKLYFEEILRQSMTNSLRTLDGYQSGPEEQDLVQGSQMFWCIQGIQNKTI